MIGEFLDSFAAGAGLTLHVRLLEGDDPEHVLDAIFKALGAALAGACAHQPREGDDDMGKDVIRTESAPGAVPGRPVLAGDRRRRLVFTAGWLWGKAIRRLLGSGAYC